MPRLYWPVVGLMIVGLVGCSDGEKTTATRHDDASSKGELASEDDGGDHASADESRPSRKSAKKDVDRDDGSTSAINAPKKAPEVDAPSASTPALAQAAAATGSCVVSTYDAANGEDAAVENDRTDVPAGVQGVYRIDATVPAGGKLQWTQYDWNPETDAVQTFGPGVLPSAGDGERQYVPPVAFGPGVAGGVTQVYCEVFDANGASLGGGVGTFDWN